MAKYHVNAAGEAGPCRATKGGCPFGGEDEHYSSPEAARAAFEESMENGSQVRYTRPNLPARIERSVIPMQLGRTNAVLMRHLEELSGDSVFVRGHLYKIHPLISDSYERVNRDTDDAFAVAAKISKQFKRLAKKDPVLAKNLDFITGAVDRAAFAYVAPHTEQKSTYFQESLRASGVNLGENEPRHFERIFATAAKKAGANSTPLQLARAFKKASVNEPWNSGPDANFDEAIIAAAKKVQHFRGGKANIDYQRELDGISEGDFTVLSSKEKLTRSHDTAKKAVKHLKNEHANLIEAEQKYNEEHGGHEGRAFYMEYKVGQLTPRRVKGINPKNGPTQYTPTRKQIDARIDATNRLHAAEAREREAKKLLDAENPTPSAGVLSVDESLELARLNERSFLSVNESILKSRLEEKRSGK